MKKRLNSIGIYYMKGATMYELQIGGYCFGWCHLKGFPGCRLSIRLFDKDGEYIKRIL